MRALLLALVIGVMSLGGLALTPTRTDAQEWSSNADTIAVRWRGGSHYRSWHGGSHYRGWYGGYYSPYYYGSYYTPYYYSYPSYNYTPGYNYYYTPGYNYYTPYSYYGAGYYGPRVSVHVGW